MQKRKQQFFALALALWAFSSCSQETSDMQGSVAGGETVTFSLNAEISVDDSDLRAIDYKLGKNAKNQLVPLPQFVDKQEVDVHTILKSRNGSAVAKTLKWRYDASKKKLVLKQDDGHSITVSGFNDEDGQKWYISGLIGGTLIDGTTRVAFAGERVLKGVDGNEGDIVSHLNVPYAFGWTELKINTTTAKDADNSYKYAEVPSNASVKFVPRGSLVAYKLGNALVSGSYTFSPTGFMVASNRAWADQGVFNLDTYIPNTRTQTSLPWFIPDPCVVMDYTFADGHAPEAIAHNGMSDKVYYAWCMQDNNTVPATRVDVRVWFKGSSSRPETATYRDYTKTYLSDFTYKSYVGLESGKVHQLTARATRRLILPIEYVTEYNLAGGDGLVKPAITSSNPGARGPLRFANSHNNDESGLYYGYAVAGRHDATLNPDTRSLQTEVDAAFGTGKYVIPTAELWGSIIPQSAAANGWHDVGRLGSHNYMGFNLDGYMHRIFYWSDYSKVFTTPGERVFYSIRFKSRPADDIHCTYFVPSQVNQANTNSNLYRYAPDNSLKSAYRYRRIGMRTSETEPRNNFSRLIIDAVYLGEESVPTSIDDISNERWWADKQAAGLVISRTFAAPGAIYFYDDDEYATFTDYHASDVDPENPKFIGNVQISDGFLGRGEHLIWVATPIRLFRTRID